MVVQCRPKQSLLPRQREARVGLRHSARAPGCHAKTFRSVGIDSHPPSFRTGDPWSTGARAQRVASPLGGMPVPPSDRLRHRSWVLTEPLLVARPRASWVAVQLAMPMATRGLSVLSWTEGNAQPSQSHREARYEPGQVGPASPTQLAWSFEQDRTSDGSLVGVEGSGPLWSRQAVPQVAPDRRRQP